MAHLVNPIGLRAGQTLLWSGSSLVSNNKNQLLSSKVGLATGLESLASWLLKYENYYVVQSTVQLNTISGVPNVCLLYYPLVTAISRKRQFPLYTNQRLLLDNTKTYNPKFLKFLLKSWNFRFKEFNTRFLSSKRKIQLNRWLGSKMFRGSSAISLRSKSKRILSYVKRNTNYYTRRLHWSRWQRSKLRFSSNYLAQLIGARSGIRVSVKSINVFRYLSLKFGYLRFKTYQNHIWQSYHRSKRLFSTFYDMVNAFYLLCMLPNTERLVVTLVQYSLLKMHRRKIKPKRFFYFVDAVIKNMPHIKTYFHACRVIVTGKLKGGTARTGSYSAGFGIFPRQSMSQDIKMSFGNLHSKYGSFGIKLLTWRKQNAFTL